MAETQPAAAPIVVVTAHKEAAAAESSLAILRAEPGLNPYPIECSQDTARVSPKVIPFVNQLAVEIMKQ
jgi:hypothetical protein